MAEYYPLLAKAVGSLPNSTLETRRVVYERARKALIGQLRTLHPPVPDEDIERESIELDRAVQRLESELAKGGLPSAAAAAPASTAAAPAAASTPASPLTKPVPPRPVPPRPTSPGSLPPRPLNRPPLRPLQTKPPSSSDGPAIGAPALETPIAEVAGVGGTVNASEGAAGNGRTRDAPAGAPPPAVFPRPSGADRPAIATRVAPRPPFRPAPGAGGLPAAALPTGLAAAEELPAALDLPKPTGETVLDASPEVRPEGLVEDGAAAEAARFDVRRPYAPQSPAGRPATRRAWIVPVGVALTVAAVAVAAYLLRDTRQSVVHAKPTEQAKPDGGKIAERVGGAPANEVKPSAAAAGATPGAAVGATPAATNPEVPVAQRAALLIEAPDEPNKVKTFLGTVVWKLNNINAGPGDAVGLGVEADVDMPDDKLKAIVTFEKNTDASLPASHTVKVRFVMQPGSLSGDVQQISVPQMRQEDTPSGEALAGVTVPVVQNSFLVGLSPGNAEGVNINQLKTMQWIDIPMLLSNGKIAKLTFEKGVPGERDLTEAIAAWQRS